jgi:hypothetical protein
MFDKKIFASVINSLGHKELEPASSFIWIAHCFVLTKQLNKDLQNYKNIKFIPNLYYSLTYFLIDSSFI